MAVSDLTGTTWLLNSSVTIEQQNDYSVNCTYSDYVFNSINFKYYSSDGKVWKGIQLGNSYDLIPITAEANPISYSGNLPLTITGGTDVTNATLIAWLEANATQALSGYTITIDSIGYSVGDGDSLLVNASGLYNTTTSTQIYSFTPTTGRFFGFNTSSGQTSPSSDYEINDTFTASQDLTLYSVEQLPTVIYDLDNLNLSVGTHTITAKAKGTDFADSVASNSVTFTVAPSTIEFYILDAQTGTTRTYVADSGMTWSQWVNSNYNTGSYYISSGGNEVAYGGAGNLWYIGLVSCGYSQLANQTINANQTYIQYNTGQCD